MSSHTIYAENELSFPIRRVVENAARGTILHALTNDQINLIVKAIIEDLGKRNLAITDIRPVDEQVLAISKSLDETVKEAVDWHTELSYARGAIEEIRQGKLDDPYTQELISKIQKPDGENNLVLYWIKNRESLKNSVNIDRMLKILENKKQQD